MRPSRRCATALTPPTETTKVADARWVAQTADHILAVMENSRSTWQMWHVRAEAQRQIRTADLPAERASALMDLLVDGVLNGRSWHLSHHMTALRNRMRCGARTDPRSTPSPAPTYTSQRILDAEQRLAVAGIRDGTVVDRTVVDLALLEMAASGTALDPGQASWSGRCAPLVLDYSSRSRPPAQENHGYARPHPCLERRRWPGARPGAVRGCSRRSWRADRHSHRHTRQTDLVLDHGELPDWATRSARRR